MGEVHAYLRRSPVGLCPSPVMHPDRTTPGNREDGCFEERVNDPIMKIYLLRHGETDMNQRGQLQGHRNTVLNQDGRLQAEIAAKKVQAMSLHFDRVFCSPLQRAVETCEIISGKQREEILLEPRILEIDFGPMEGKTYAEFDDSLLLFFEDPSQNPVPEGMESTRDLLNRVTDFFDELISGGSDQESILISTHGVTLRAMFAYFLKKNTDAVWSMPVGNCNIFEVDVKAGDLVTVHRPVKIIGEDTDPFQAAVSSQALENEVH